jgi:thiamine pyrophosphate-dependent acetolactate synthase large subunit-like protein
MKRYDALKSLAGIITKEDIVVTSIGGVKPEWYSVMPGDGTMFTDLLGCATPMALGVAMALPHRRVLAFDADGSMLFGLGALCTVANESPPNLTIVVFDNEQYESVTGGHRTATRGRADLERIAAGAGIPCTATVRDTERLIDTVSKMLSDREVGLLVAKVEPGVFTNISPERYKESDGLEDKYRFIRYIERLEKITIRPRHVRD